MERFEGRCQLDWWANSSTVFSGTEVEVTITSSGPEWVARGRLITDDDDQREGFVFLCDLDPVFAMRFDGGGTLPVTIHDLRDGGRRFALTEYRGPRERTIDTRFEV